MKRILLFFSVVAIAVSASAQYYVDEKNKDILHIRQPRNVQRKEFYAPNIDGYTAYKADLHTHTVFSDGHFSMPARIREAWVDGLDVMAVTEHLEYRSHEKTFVKYYQRYMPKGTKAQYCNFVSKNRPADKSAIKVDFNLPVEVARTAAAPYDITIIPGIEITRKEGEYSHFNALFTSDNNAIYAPETIQSLRNAKAQNALVMHNHPGWTHKDMKLTAFEKVVYKEGLIDGIEVMNGVEFYPKAIARAEKYNLFISSNTDIHDPTCERYSYTGARRNMTIIYAKDKSLASLREAIEAHRTLAYSFGTLVGSEELLRKFFMASVVIRKSYVDSKGQTNYILTNHRQFP
jgi:predicted metal-dependent phosphoesterase TrpH